MMNFLIFSDSHGDAVSPGQILQRWQTKPDMIFFLGDGWRDWDALRKNGISFYCVRGNCDFCPTPDAPPFRQMLQVEGHRMLLTHGHLFSVKHGTGALLEEALRSDADIVLFGHTHIPSLEVIPAGGEVFGHVLRRPLYLFNPGSVGAPAHSFGTLYLSGDAVLFSHGSL